MNTPANTNAQETLFDELRHLLNDTGVSNETLLTEVKKAHSFIEASKLTAGVMRPFSVAQYVSADGRVKQESVTALANYIATSRKGAVDDLKESQRLATMDALAQQ